MLSRFLIYLGLAQLTIVAHDWLGFHSGVYMLTFVFYAAAARVLVVIRQTERQEADNA
jgi:hypothetical protein